MRSCTICGGNLTPATKTSDGRCLGACAAIKKPDVVYVETAPPRRMDVNSLGYQYLPQLDEFVHAITSFEANWPGLGLRKLIDSGALGERLARLALKLSEGLNDASDGSEIKTSTKGDSFALHADSTLPETLKSGTCPRILLVRAFLENGRIWIDELLARENPRFVETFYEWYREVQSNSGRFRGNKERPASSIVSTSRGWVYRPTKVLGLPEVELVVNNIADISRLTDGHWCKLL